MTKRSEKWPSIAIEKFHRSKTGRTTKILFSRDNALALATELLKRAEAGYNVELKLMGENPRAVNVKSISEE